MPRQLTKQEQQELNETFSYHAPTGDQPGRYEAVRQAGKEFAEVILENTWPCPDQSAAIRKAREAVMTANAAIALEQSKGAQAV